MGGHIDKEVLGQAGLPDGARVNMVGTTYNKWIDDFGGAAIDATLWDVFPGGRDGGNIIPTAMQGTGVSTGMSATIANSVLQMVMGATADAELWLVSKKMFTVPFDIYAGLILSQRIINQNLYIEIVECDPITGKLIPHATIAGEARNRAGVGYQSNASTGAADLFATCDDSPVGAGVNGVNLVSTTGWQSTVADHDIAIEFRPVDTFASSLPMDSVAIRNSAALRLSKQVPDPNKTYKLRIRMKNGSTAPASTTTATIYRVCVMDVQEVQVELASGRGDNTPGKSIAVNLVGHGTGLPTGSNVIGGVVPVASTGPASNTTALRRFATADTNLATIKASAGKLMSGLIQNLSAATKFVKLYNKASNPVPGTDVPVFTIPVLANGAVDLASVLGSTGHTFNTGIALAITGALADADTTAVAANDVVINALYV